ncbi:hypothetical protein GJAV_G00160720 [Gymnothorax javanicus]|nr:hypothetical protein GJAV_G00160720 [Gymnothorax javanicus]
MDTKVDSHTHNSGMEVFSKQTDEQHGADRLSSVGKFSNVGRNSLDIFSPVRNDAEFLSQYSSSLPRRWTPLGTPKGQCCGSPAVFESPPVIKEEETESHLAAMPDVTQVDCKNSRPSLDLESQTMALSLKTTQTPLKPQSSAAAAPSCNPALSGKLPSSASDPNPSTMGVASSLSDRIVETIGAEPGGAPLTSLQINFIRNMIQETLEDFRDACHKDIVNLQFEMIRQFYIQLMEIHGLIERYSVTDTLVEEIQKLKEENRRLRSNY